MIQRAIANGRLERSVTYNAKGWPSIDVAEADREWEANRDFTKLSDGDLVKLNARGAPKSVPADSSEMAASAASNGCSLRDLNPPVAAVYKIRELLDPLITLAFSCRCDRTADECRAVLEALQRIPIHLRTIEDAMAEAGIPLMLKQGKGQNR